jgi:hypothetical protein
MGNQSAHFFSL